MPRKSKQTAETEKEPFPTALRRELEERSITQKELAEFLGIARQTVSLYCTGQSSPDINILRKIADCLGVSADYLLGKTNAKTTEMELRSVCDYTGLSEEAVKKLHFLSKSHSGIYGKCLSKTILSKFFEKFVHSAELLTQMKDEYIEEVLDSSYFIHVTKMESWGLLRDIYKEIVKEFKKTPNEPSFTEEKGETLSTEQTECEDSSHGDD